MRIRVHLSIAMAAAAAAVGCSGEKANTPERQNAPVENVAVTRVALSPVQDYYEATGTVAARTTTQVSANIMGRIVSFPAAEGDRVSRGQLIAEIDDSESRTRLLKAEGALREAEAARVEIARSADTARAAVATAEANKQIADVTYERYRQLFDRASASAQEFDEAKSRLRVATTELDRARAGVESILARNKQVSARIDQAKAEIANIRVVAGYSRIVSPVNGTVVKKFAEAGATASPGAPLVSIEDSSQYRLEVAVEESRGSSIHVGGRVLVNIDATGRGEFEGRVSEVLPTADAASRTYTVKIDLPGDPALRSGLYGSARFAVGERDVITIPDTALVQRGQLTGVYVVGSEGTVQFRIVTTGRSAEGSVEVLTGISEGDEVAASGTDRLADEVRVR